jgi:phospholipid transport system substrate-binding protein
VDYQGEKILDDYASVKIALKTKDGIDHPVEYRMQSSSSGWRVYDVVVEGVSLVKNYRDQFDAIINKSSYDGLIKEIRSKLQEKP